LKQCLNFVYRKSYTYFQIEFWSWKDYNKVLIMKIFFLLIFCAILLDQSLSANVKPNAKLAAEKHLEEQWTAFKVTRFWRILKPWPLGSPQQILSWASSSMIRSKISKCRQVWSFSSHLFCAYVAYETSQKNFFPLMIRFGHSFWLPPFKGQEYLLKIWQDSIFNNYFSPNSRKLTAENSDRVFLKLKRS
jgi:hypothetical protein